MKSKNASRRLLLAFGLVCCALAATCVFPKKKVPRNQWSADWGPLVPHGDFPADCGICHLPDRWDELRADFSYDHAQETGVALAGAHVEAACLRCHNDFGPVAAYAERGCRGCHLDPHQGQLGVACERCHNERDWRPGGLVAEHARTRFPLVGVHIAVACELCHPAAPTGAYRGAPTDCAVCHRDDLQQATTPNHNANGWTVRCERCHFPTTWRSGFTHGFFPLSGGHAINDCRRCHTSGTFGPIPADCYSCHRDDYERAPNHVAANFPRTCENCHNTSTWDGAAFDHRFPLTGGHAINDCRRCHTSGTFGPIPADCYSCHRDDYERAPNHVTANYPRTCENCHNTSKWEGAVFNHRFPLRGDHNVDCSVCHQGGNTSTFTCLVCHDHSRARMDDKHDEVNGYTYTSSACLQCHPNGDD